MKNAIIEAVDANAAAILKLSHAIHANPELGFEEFKAAAWQAELLAKHGFAVERPYCGLETSYRATLKGGSPGPCVAFLAEYDALQGLGHGCGHNIIASSAVGAAIGLAKAMSSLAGEIAVIGTPAEEGGGGKIQLVERGAFDGVACALMMHPSVRNIIGRGGLACVSVGLEFFGKAAHSAGPERGVNALTAVIQVFNAVDTLRQTWRADAKVNGIITAGGQASNIIPDYAAAKFTVRSQTRAYLLKMVEDLKKLAAAATLVTGAEHKVTLGLVYAERYPNKALGEAFKANLEFLGETMGYPSPDEIIGSSDIGNVSMVTPAIHEYLSIAPESVNSHSADFREAAASPRADEVVLKAAKGLAMTAFDFLSGPALRQTVAEEFRTTVAAAR